MKLEIKGFIESIGMYNEGNASYEGKWIKFPIEEDKKSQIMHEIGCDLPGYEEYFFTDWECNIDLEFGEYESIDHVNEVTELLEEYINDYGEEIVNAVIELEGNSTPLEEVNFNNYMLLEDVTDEYDLGEYFIEESGCYDLSNLGNLADYIDYERFGRDIAFEHRGMFTEYGYVYEY